MYQNNTLTFQPTSVIFSISYCKDGAKDLNIEPIMAFTIANNAEIAHSLTKLRKQQKRQQKRALSLSHKTSSWWQRSRVCKVVHSVDARVNLIILIPLVARELTSERAEQGESWAVHDDFFNYRYFETASRYNSRRHGRIVISVILRTYKK